MSSAERSRFRTRSPEKVSTKSAVVTGLGFGGLLAPGGGGEGLEEDGEEEEGGGGGGSGGGSLRRRWFAEPLDSCDGGGDVELERWRFFAQIGTSGARVEERGKPPAMARVNVGHVSGRGPSSPSQHSVLVNRKLRRVR